MSKSRHFFPRCFPEMPSLQACNGNSKSCSYDLLLIPSSVRRRRIIWIFSIRKPPLPEKTIRRFLIGCSTSSARQPTSDGYEGFGRSIFSLPVQMGVKKFSYCLNSHYYDDTRNSSKLILDNSDGETRGLSYTPFLKNPPDWPIYYYLGEKDIMIGNKTLAIPRNYLAPGADGSGGLMIVPVSPTDTWQGRFLR